MNKQITLGQMLGSVLTLVMAIVGGWIVLKTEVAQLHTNQNSNTQRIEVVERKLVLEDAEKKSERKEQEQYREETLKLLYEIKIEMERKKNR